MNRYYRNHREEDLDCSSKIVRNEVRYLRARNAAAAFNHTLSCGPAGRPLRVLVFCRGGRVIRKKYSAPPAGDLRAFFRNEIIERLNGQLVIRTSAFRFELRLRP